MGKPKLPVKFHKKVVVKDDDEPSPVLDKIVGTLITILPILVIIVVGIILTRGKFQEVVFTIKHPQMVRELKEIYQLEHDEADKAVLMRQRMALPEEETKKE